MPLKNAAWITDQGDRDLKSVYISIYVRWTMLYIYNGSWMWNSIPKHIKILNATSRQFQTLLQVVLLNSGWYILSLYFNIIYIFFVCSRGGRGRCQASLLFFKSQWRNCSLAMTSDYICNSEKLFLHSSGFKLIKVYWRAKIITHASLRICIRCISVVIRKVSETEAFFFLKMDADGKSVSPGLFKF